MIIQLQLQPSAVLCCAVLCCNVFVTMSSLCLQTSSWPLVTFFGHPGEPAYRKVRTVYLHSSPPEYLRPCLRPNRKEKKKKKRKEKTSSPAHVLTRPALLYFLVAIITFTLAQSIYTWPPIRILLVHANLGLQNTDNRIYGCTCPAPPSNAGAGALNVTCTLPGWAERVGSHPRGPRPCSFAEF